MKGDNQGAEELAVTKGLDHLPHPPLTPGSGGSELTGEPQN